MRNNANISDQLWTLASFSRQHAVSNFPESILSLLFDSISDGSEIFDSGK